MAIHDAFFSKPEKLELLLSEMAGRFADTVNEELVLKVFIDSASQKVLNEKEKTR